MSEDRKAVRPVPKPVRRNLRLKAGISILALTVATMTAGVGTAHDWTGAVSGDWRDPANWAQGTVPSNSGAPVDATLIDRVTPNATVLSGTAGGAATSYRLDVGAAGTGRLSILAGATLTSSGGVIGNAEGSIGIVEMAGNARWNPGTLAVGAAGNGTLLLQSGSSITNLSGLTVAASAGSSGAVTVTGSNSALTVGNVEVHFGDLGRATLVVEDRGRLVTGRSLHFGFGVGSEAEARVSGPDSLISSNFTLGIGISGQAALRVENGAIARSSGLGITVGGLAGSKGSVVVTGAGSTLQGTYGIDVGVAGEGSVRIENGALATMNSAGNIYFTIGKAAGGKGEVVVSGAGSRIATSNLQVGEHGAGKLLMEAGATADPTRLSVGIREGSSGEVILRGAGTKLVDGNLHYIGSFGKAEVLVAEGASIQSAYTTIGVYEGGDATVTVTGAGSQYHATGQVGSIAAFDVGSSGHGRVVVSDGGMLLSEHWVSVGAGIGSGSVLVTGTGSRVVINRNDLRIGIEGYPVGPSRGSFTIEAGGATQITRDAGVGYDAVGIGTLTVSGAGSSLTVGRNLMAGRQGRGEVSVLDGATATVNQLVSVANFAGSSGTLRVDGAGSALTGRSFGYIGLQGSGELGIANGGRFDLAGSLSLGGYRFDPATAGTGRAVVTGTGSTLAVAGWLDVGGSSVGSLAIADGATVSAGYGVVIANLATASGVLAIGSGLDGAGNPLAPVAPALLDTGSSANEGGGVLRFGAGDGRLLFNHTGTDYAFGTAIAGSGTIQHRAGGTALTGDGTAFNGTIAMQGGRLDVNGDFSAATVSASAGILGGSGSVGATTIGDGATLSGRFDRQLTLASLSLAAGSTTAVELAAPSSTALFNVRGDVSLAGTLAVEAAPDFGNGVYRLIDYGGSLTDNGLAVGAAPRADYQIQTAVAGQVNLVVGNYAPLDTRVLFWDGTGTGPDGQAGGGAGTWNTLSSNWTVADGSVNLPWAGSFAVFQSQGGTVTVEGRQSATGLQFAGQGYVLTSGADGALHLAGATAPVPAGLPSANTAVIRVDPSMSAEVALPVTVDGHLRKLDAGTVRFSGPATVSQAVLADGGVLAVAPGGTLASSFGVVGSTAGFAGGVVVDGAGARWQVGRSLAVGSEAAGSLSVANGGTVAAGEHVHIGARPGGPGSVSITGTGSVLEAAQNVAVGLAGAGELIVAAGGSVRAPVIEVGGEATGRGSVLIGGVGSAAAPGTLQADRLAFGAGGGDLVFNHTASDYVFAASLSGNGTVSQQAGTTILTGDNAGFSGTTRVAGGTLRVGIDGRGALGGGFTVAAGGILGGTGPIGSAGADVVIEAGAIHAPGNSIGTQTILGNYVNRGTLQIEATPTASDRLVVAGAVDLTGAALDLLLSPASPTAWALSNGPYLLIDKQSAGAVTGSFARVTSNLVFMTPEVSYTAGDGNDVSLLLTRNAIAFSDVATTRNQAAVARAIETLPDTDPIWRSVVLAPSEDVARSAMAQLSGEIHASARAALVEDSRYVRQAQNERLRSAFGAPGTAASTVVAYSSTGTPVLSSGDHAGPVFWAQGFGVWGRGDGDRNAARLSRSTGGVLAGADIDLRGWRVGVSGGYSRSRFEASGLHARGDSDNYHLGVYAGGQWGGFGLRTGVSYTWHAIETRRSVAFIGFADNLSARYDAGTTQAFAELGYTLGAGGFAFEPFANLAYAGFRNDAFAERGGAASLVGNGGSFDTVFTTLGARVSTSFSLGGIQATARGMLGWRHAFGDTEPLSTLRFVAGTPFTVAGTPLARNAAVFEAGLDLKLAPSATLGLSYQGQIGSGTQDHGFRANLAMRF